MTEQYSEPEKPLLPTVSMDTLITTIAILTELGVEGYHRAVVDVFTDEQPDLSLQLASFIQDGDEDLKAKSLATHAVLFVYDTLRRQAVSDAMNRDFNI
jgi:hypothetical protein